MDVDYLFLQVQVDKSLVSDTQNCGNILAGIAPFSIERGLVKPKPELSEDLVKESPTPIAPVSEVSDPLKVSSRLATFTLVSVLKNQGLFSQALEVLDALEEKGESLESISLERETIQTLIDRSKKD